MLGTPVRAAVAARRYQQLVKSKIKRPLRALSGPFWLIRAIRAPGRVKASVGVRGSKKICSDPFFCAEGVGSGRGVRVRPRKRGVDRKVWELWPKISVGEDQRAAMRGCTEVYVPDGR